MATAPNSDAAKASTDQRKSNNPNAADSLVAIINQTADRIKTITPTAPYVLCMHSDTPYRLPGPQRQDWRRGLGNLFDDDEDYLQYQSFYYRDVDDKGLFTIQAGYEVEAARQKRVPKSGGGTPMTTGATKKRSFVDYLRDKKGEPTPSSALETGDGRASKKLKSEETALDSDSAAQNPISIPVTNDINSQEAQAAQPPETSSSQAPRDKTAGPDGLCDQQIVLESHGSGRKRSLDESVEAAAKDDEDGTCSSHPNERVRLAEKDVKPSDHETEESVQSEGQTSSNLPPMQPNGKYNGDRMINGSTEQSAIDENSTDVDQRDPAQGTSVPFIQVQPPQAARKRPLKWLQGYSPDHQLADISLDQPLSPSNSSASGWVAGSSPNTLNDIESFSNSLPPDQKHEEETHLPTTNDQNGLLPPTSDATITSALTTKPAATSPFSDTVAQNSKVSPSVTSHGSQIALVKKDRLSSNTIDSKTNKSLSELAPTSSSFEAVAHDNAIKSTSTSKKSGKALTKKGSSSNDEPDLKESTSASEPALGRSSEVKNVLKESLSGPTERQRSNSESAPWQADYQNLLALGKSLMTSSHSRHASSDQNVAEPPRADRMLFAIRRLETVLCRVAANHVLDQNKPTPSIQNWASLNSTAQKAARGSQDWPELYGISLRVESSICKKAAEVSARLAMAEPAASTSQGDKDESASALKDGEASSILRILLQAEDLEKEANQKLPRGEFATKFPEAYEASRDEPLLDSSGTLRTARIAYRCLIEFAQQHELDYEVQLDEKFLQDYE